MRVWLFLLLVVVMAVNGLPTPPASNATLGGALYPSSYARRSSSARRPRGPEHHQPARPPSKSNWTVEGERAGNVSYQQQNGGSTESVEDSYRATLPDGRARAAEHEATDLSGFVADVRHQHSDSESERRLGIPSHRTLDHERSVTTTGPVTPSFAVGNENEWSSSFYQDMPRHRQYVDKHFVAGYKPLTTEYSRTNGTAPTSPAVEGAAVSLYQSGVRPKYRRLSQLYDRIVPPLMISTSTTVPLTVLATDESVTSTTVGPASFTKEHDTSARTFENTPTVRNKSWSLYGRRIKSVAKWTAETRRMRNQLTDGGLVVAAAESRGSDTITDGNHDGHSIDFTYSRSSGVSDQTTENASQQRSK